MADTQQELADDLLDAIEDSVEEKPLPGETVHGDLDEHGNDTGKSVVVEAKPLTQADLDPEYLKFHDLLVYTRVIATSGFETADCPTLVSVGWNTETDQYEYEKFEAGEEFPHLKTIEVIDVEATLPKIEAAKARAAIRRARKLCWNPPTFEILPGDSRQVRRFKARMALKKPVEDKVGLSRADRRRMLKKMPPHIRKIVMNQYRQIASIKVEAPEHVDAAPKDETTES